MKGGSFFMAQRKNRIKAWLTRTLEIPPDVMMDLPRITMVGRLHIYIENHRGLLLFSDNEVRLMLKQGSASFWQRFCHQNDFAGRDSFEGHD
jgi:hypothetical protein